MIIGENMSGRLLLTRLSRGMKSLFSLLRPHTRTETCLFFASLLFFYSFLFAFLYLRNDALGYALMGYDTMSNSFQFYFPYVHCWHLRHPLMAMFSLPLSCIRWVIAQLGSDPGWVIYTLPVPVFSAFSNLLVFKLLRSQMVSRRISLLMVVMFSGFAHVILLSWQYESFPFSMFLLLLFTLYIVKKGGDICQDNILFALIAGITSTNLLKFCAGILIAVKGLRQGLLRILRSPWLFCILMVLPALQLVLASIRHGNFWGHFITNATGYSFKETDTLSALWDNFLCEPIMFHNLGRIFYDESVIHNVGAFCSVMSPYTSSLIPLLVITIYVAVAMSWIVFRKTLLVRLFLSFLLIDLFILLILGYGKNEAQLFCMHWFFCIPISVGMLLQRVSKTLTGGVILAIFSVISLSSITYNTYHYYDSLINPALTDNYEHQLKILRGKANVQTITDVRLFLFGMGDRPKLLYRDKKLRDIEKDSVILDLSSAEKDVILPDQYKVVAYCENGDSTVIYEDEKAVWIRKGNEDSMIAGSDNPIVLPSFEGFRYSQVLRVLHQEILFNIKDSCLYPNIFAYGSVWLRDAAMGAMVLEKTGNLSLIRKWTDGMTDIYDSQNNEREGDNIGEFLYLKSLSSGGVSHGDMLRLNEEINSRKTSSSDGVYIRGMTDGADNDFYATAWLKYALSRNPVAIDVYSFPPMGGVYKYLCWFVREPCFKERCKRLLMNALGDKSSGKSQFPYLQWAVAHSFRDWEVPMSASQYPLSWEMSGEKASFGKMKIIDADAYKHSICFPHTWTAAEMFLYLYTFSPPAH